MSLLTKHLPHFSLRPKLPIHRFFENCSTVAMKHGWRIDRRSNGFEQLNLFLGCPSDEKPMLRMVALDEVQPIQVDVVLTSSTDDYDTYVPAAKTACKRFLAAYNTEFKTNLRVGIPRRTAQFDPASVNVSSLRYAHEKFDRAVYDLAVGEGDVRSRLRSASITLIAITPADLPEPLDEHFQWVRDTLTKHESTRTGEGNLDATLARMRNSTGRTVAERIVALRAAIEEALESAAALNRSHP